VHVDTYQTKSNKDQKYLSKWTGLLSLPTHRTLPCEFPCLFPKAVMWGPY
jgi:hypothetical protein